MEQQIQQNHSTRPRRRGMFIVILLAGLVVGAGGMWLALRSSEPGGTETTSATTYTCPMHPTIVQDHPGDCPICGMKLIPKKSDQAEAETSDGPRKILFYRSPMDPNVMSHEPKKDEMGMDYIPVYDEELTGGEGTVEGRAAVTIDPERQQLIGLRLAPVTRSDVSSGWRTVGRVQVDQTRVAKVNVKVTGYVERVFVDFVGRPVKRGEALFTLYSPDLLAAQQEYLLALKTRDAYAAGGGLTENGDALVNAARQKLKLWDVTEAQIDHLEQAGEAVKTVTIVSPAAGVVTAKNVVEGSTLKPGDTPYEVTDLSSVWVLADAYQSDMEHMKVGMPATFTLEALPGRVFTGKVAFIDPLLDPQSRTLKVRLNFENKNGELKPDMFGEVQLQSEAKEALTIPADAIIPSGRGNFVFVDVGKGKFEPRAVEVGAKSGDNVEVISGLREGEQVVTRANFLIDSESSLRAALAAIGGS